jgi:hypothetical protein
MQFSQNLFRFLHYMFHVVTKPFQVSSKIVDSSKKNTTNGVRELISQGLMMRSQNGRVDNGSIGYFARTYSVSERTVKRIWSKTKTCVSSGVPVNVS